MGFLLALVQVILTVVLFLIFVFLFIWGEMHFLGLWLITFIPCAFIYTLTFIVWATRRIAARFMPEND